MRDRSTTRWRPRPLPVWLAVCGLALLFAGRSAFGVMLASGDGTGNTTAPRDDPGWDRMATRADCPPECQSTFVYLGESWFISTQGAGPQDVRIESTQQVYKKVPKGAYRIGRKEHPTNLVIFRVQDGPDLPLIPISMTPPVTGTEVVLIGRGLSRGQETRQQRTKGWDSQEPAVMRWGTNRISQTRVEKMMRMFFMRFDDPAGRDGTRYECQAVTGDLGGGVFVKKGKVWELAGIIVGSTEAYLGAGKTYAVDLAKYREEILEIIESRR